MLYSFLKYSKVRLLTRAVRWGVANRDRKEADVLMSFFNKQAPKN
jgi:hypothetical protein